MEKDSTLMKMLMEKSRSAYRQFATLCEILNDYSFNENDETRKQLKAIIKTIHVGMPLPSGRYGNALAVALEMQFYKGALFIIQNADELGINLNSISSEYGGINNWDAQQTFELSQLGFKTVKKDENDEFYKDYPALIEVENSNIDAAIEIAKILQKRTNKIVYL